MSKEDIRRQIRDVQDQISNKKRELRELEEKAETLERMLQKCTQRANSFETSMSRRRNRLAGVTSLVNVVKAAAGYQRAMNDLLTGNENQRAANAVNEIIDKTSNQKRRVNQEILEAEDRLERLNERLDRLWYQYNTYPEEEA